MSISFVYLDEFGHIGPYMSRSAAHAITRARYLGLRGFILPEHAVRPFATKFLQLKEHIFEI